MDKEFYTVQEVMDILHLSKRTAYKLVHKSEFPKFRMGHRYLIPKISVLSG